MVGIKVQIDSHLCNPLPTEPAFLIGTTEPARILCLVPQLPAPPDTSALVWTSEHARLISAMCVGGINVLGLYVPSGNTGTTATDVEVAAALARRIFVRLSIMRANSLVGPLVLCKGVKGKPAVKLIPTEASESPRQADLRITQGLSDNIIILRGHVTLQGITTGFVQEGVDLETACIEYTNKLTLHAIIDVSGAGKQSVIIDSEDDDRSLSSLMGWPSSSTSKKKPDANVPPLQDINVLFPSTLFSSRPLTLFNKDSMGSMKKSVALHGLISVFAVVLRDTAAGEALRNVRSDMSRSLRARVDIAHEMDDSELQNSSAKGRSPLPIRVVAWPSEIMTCSKLPMTDYLIDSSSLEEVKSHFAEILSWSKDDLSLAHFEQTEEFPSEFSGKDNDEESFSPSNTIKNRPPPIPDVMLRDHDEGVPQLLLNGVILAITLAIAAIILKQFL